MESRYAIVCSASGDTAEAETAEDALVAADTLARDYADDLETWGALRSARATLYIVENGTFNGTLTGLAQAGYRALLSDAWSRS